MTPLVPHARESGIRVEQRLEPCRISRPHDIEDLLSRLHRCPLTSEGKPSPQRKRPALSPHALSESVTKRQLRRVATHRPRRSKTQREPGVAALAGRFLAV